jgi:RNA polymerase sigma-70 factor (ECF subfamily)
LAVSPSSTDNPILYDPDVQLMLRVRDADDAAAFEELMLRYQNRLIAVLEHVVGRRDLAEDLAQDVFLRVYRARKRYVPGAKFSTWLFTIANNAAFNALRSRARRHEISIAQQGNNSTGVMSLEQLAQARSSAMPARQADKTEMRDVIQDAMATLNERQRMAVLLSKFESMSYEEIAETMEMTPQAIKSLLSRARGNLRAVLEPYLETGKRLPPGNHPQAP